MIRVFFFCLLLFLPVQAFAQSEDEDRGFIQGLLEDALSAPGRKVSVEGFAGLLSSRATIERITVTDPEGIWFTAEDLAMTWNRRALLSGSIDIEEITAKRIELPRLPAPQDEGLQIQPEADPDSTGLFELPELPVSVSIADMTVEQANVGEALFGQAATVSISGAADLSGGTGDVAVSVNRLDREGRLGFKGAFDNATRQLLLDLDLSEPADGIAVNLLSLPDRPSIRLTAAGDDPIEDFKATIHLDTDGQERLAGDVTLITEDNGTSRFQADIGGDLAPVLAPDFRPFLGNAIQLTSAGFRSPTGDLVLSDLTLQASALQLQGAAEISKDGWPRQLALDIDITPPVGNNVVLPLPGAQTSVSSAHLNAGFNALAGDEWTVSGQISDFAREGLTIENLDIRGAGEISRELARVFGDISLGASGIEPEDQALARAIGTQLAGNMRFDWEQGSALHLTGLDLSGADYGLNGRIDIATPDGTASVSPDVTLTASDLRRFAGLAQLSLSGAAELAISGAANPATGAMDLMFQGTTLDLATGIAQIDPVITGRGQVSLHLIRDGDGFRADPLEITTNQASVTLVSDLKTQGSSARLRAMIEDVGVSVAGLTGPANLTAEAQENSGEWNVLATASLPGTSRMQLNSRFMQDPAGSWKFDGNAEAAVGQLSAFSTLAKRPLSGRADLTVAGQGAISGQELDLTVKGTLTDPAFGVAAVEPLLRGTSQVTLDARLQDQVWDIAQLKVAASSLLADLSGQLGAETGALAFNLSLPDLGVIVPDFPGAARLSGTAGKTGETWTLDATGSGPGGISLAANGTAAQDASTFDMTLNGTARLETINPHLSGQDLSGPLDFALSLNGPPELNSLSGKISLPAARLSIPAAGVALENIRADADLNSGTANLSLTGDVSSGGEVRLKGPVTLAPPFAADLELALRRVHLSDPTLYDTRLKGDLRVDGALAGGATVSGEIELTDAELRIPKFGASYSALDGLRHIYPSSAVRQTLRFAGLEEQPAPPGPSTGPSYLLDLLISAPNQLFIRGRGLDAELSGSVRLTGTSRDVIPVGGLELTRGRLDLLSRRLELTEGSAQLSGSFDPVIDFSASSQVDDIEVSLRLSGLASEPDLTVTSVPELPEDEALSYFLFGRDATSISPVQAVQLAAALRTLSGQGGLGLTGQLRQGLNLDDLDIGTDSDGKAQATIGTYVSDQLYTDVTIKSDGNSRINLNLDVSDKITVRGSVDNDGDTGIGVFFERDY